MNVELAKAHRIGYAHVFIRNPVQGVAIKVTDILSAYFYEMKSWTLQVSMPPMNHLPQGLYTIYANLAAKLLVAVIKYFKF